MTSEINFLETWVPEQMGPGSVFVLDNAGEVGEPEDPYWAILACPECAALGLITRKQVAGLVPVICGSDTCSAHFFINGEMIIPRKSS